MPFGKKRSIIKNRKRVKKRWTGIFSTVIFDLDGTLLDTLGDLAAAGERVCAAHGWPPHTEDAYRRFVGNGIPKLVERFSPPARRDADTLAATLAEFKAEYAAHMLDRTHPYPGIPALLAALARQGVQMAVYSNKDDALAGRVVAHYFGAGTFAAVHGARPGVPTKPDPQGVRALLKELGADAARTVFVGDSDVDVYTAHNAGLPCCGVLWGFRGRAELTAAGAECLAADEQELQNILLHS